MPVVARSTAHEIQDTSLLPHEVQGTCPPIQTYLVQGTRSPVHQSATIFIISSFLQRLWSDSVTLCKFEVETLRASHHVSHYGVSRSNAKVKQACLFYQTEASSEWTRLDDAHNNPRFAKEDMEVPPNINNLVFDGGIQFDLLADVPIRQPMKKRAGRDQEKPRDQVQISP